MVDLIPSSYPHLSCADDLVTSHEQTRAGFVSLALERCTRASRYVDEARVLQSKASRAKVPDDLLGMSDLREGLITAAGVSDKAAGHLENEDKTTAIIELIGKYLKPAGDKFVEELVFRYLLTRGDTLGGSMRNVGGLLAQRKLTRYLMASLRLAGVSYSWISVSNQKGLWGPSTVEDDADSCCGVKGICWVSAKGSRKLFFNIKVPLVKNSVDLILLDARLQDNDEAVIADSNRYIALGELKGGIDPAGADEHWKTARSALERIRSKFAAAKLHPSLFFVGAAIEKSMAVELWQDLESGLLVNAANLNDDAQVSSVCSWLQDL